ncbi:hypothetical protein BJ742DRAFT_843488 [Cladochytrium replicatum]|nr:hypothetical protein BJ742DRAFT_843488 [Cladochytrium replicatum]
MRLLWTAIIAAIGIPVGSVASLYAVYRILNYTNPIPPVPKGSQTDKSIQAPLTPVIPEDKDAIKKGDPTIYAVVGGGGFLGCYIVYRLLRTRNVKKVFVFDLSLGSSAWLFEGREEVEFVKLDVTKRDDVEKAITESCAEVVFLTAAVLRPQDYLSKDYARSYKVNVEGAENVVRACAAAPSVKYLVNTGSIAISLGWDRYNKDRFWDLNEEQALPAQKHFSHYGKTKCLAEEIVLSMDGKGVRTVSIRAGGIYGYGDSLVFARLKGATSVNTFLLNLDYVENTAQALISAADALRTYPENVAGRAFFATDGLVIDQAGLVKAYKKIRPDMVPTSSTPVPGFVIFAISVIGDIMYRLGSQTAPLTLSSYFTIMRSFTFSNEAAIKALGDWRRWTPEESLGRTVYLSELHQSRLLQSGKSD